MCWCSSSTFASNEFAAVVAAVVLVLFFANSPKCLFTRWKNEKWHSIETHKFARSTCGEEQPSRVSRVPTPDDAVLLLKNMEIENDCHWCVNWLAANKYIIFICFIFYYLLAIYCLLFNIDGTSKKKRRKEEAERDDAINSIHISELTIRVACACQVFFQYAFKFFISRIIPCFVCLLNGAQRNICRMFNEKRLQPLYTCAYVNSDRQKKNMSPHQSIQAWWSQLSSTSGVNETKRLPNICCATRTQSRANSIFVHTLLFDQLTFYVFLDVFTFLVGLHVNCVNLDSWKRKLCRRRPLLRKKKLNLSRNGVAFL